MSIDIIILILFGLSLFFILLSFLTNNSLKREVENLKDYSYEQSQELYALRERISSLETFTGISMTNTMSFTTEIRNLSELTKENIINLYSEGRSPEDIAIFANIPIETVQVLIDRYIADSMQ